MQRSKSEFGIYLVELDKDHLCVDGRCFESPIEIGDSFKVVYELVSDKNIHNPTVDFTVANPRRVSLHIDQILYYRSQVKVIESGFTARLILSGEGKELIKKDDVLGIESQDESI